MPRSNLRGFSNAAADVPTSEVVLPAPSEAAARPAPTAGKPAWVAYAESVGVDATGTKAVIIARVDNR